MCFQSLHVIVYIREVVYSHRGKIKFLLSIIACDWKNNFKAKDCYYLYIESYCLYSNRLTMGRRWMFLVSCFPLLHLNACIFSNIGINDSSLKCDNVNHWLNTGKDNIHCAFSIHMNSTSKKLNQSHRYSYIYKSRRKCSYSFEWPQISITFPVFWNTNQIYLILALLSQFLTIVKTGVYV